MNPGRGSTSAEDGQRGGPGAPALGPIASALEPAWELVLDAVLAPLERPALRLRDAARLAPRVAALSQAYNEAKAEGARSKLPLEARIAFSFPRDVPKGAAAVRELVATGTLRLSPDRPLRVLDLGAGLGAMSWGLARALAQAGARGRVEATLVDEDRAVLAQAEALGRSAREHVTLGEVTLDLRTASESLGTRRGLPPSIFSGRADVVFLGQVLSELDLAADSDARTVAHAGLLHQLLDEVVAEDGSLVVVEPALRNRTRHLHAVRDRLLALRPETAVFAPCLHAAACPALAVPDEWCHEDLAIDLPDWLAPLARAAGLRWQGLTFSYLVLRRDGATLARALPPRADGAIRFRAISAPLISKGKVELFTCGEDAVRRRLRRLDRDEERHPGLPFSELARGDIVTVGLPAATSGAEASGAPIDERGRIGSHVAIDVARPGK